MKIWLLMQSSMTAAPSFSTLNQVVGADFGLGHTLDNSEIQFIFHQFFE